MSGLELKDVRVQYRQAGRGERVVHAVDGVDLSVTAGETLGLVGESGCGKTTTAQAVLRLVESDSGLVRFDGIDVTALGARGLRRLRRRMQIIYQDPYESLDPRFRVEATVAEPLVVHREGTRDERREGVEQGLELAGLTPPGPYLDRDPHELSGGQRQRVMIAMALANNPDLLIADEPTTALDVTVQAQVLKLLKDLQAETRMALLLITHDLGIVRHMADKVCVMQHGKIVEAGETEKVFSNPQHAYTKMLLAAEPKGKPPRSNETAPVVVKADKLKVWFPIKRGFFRRFCFKRFQGILNWRAYRRWIRCRGSSACPVGAMERENKSFPSASG